MSFPEKRVHFIGIGGVGMSGIAKMLLAEGLSVSGSDMRPAPVLDELRRLGATVSVGHSPENLPESAETVIVSAAIPEDNPELLLARRGGKVILRYSEALGLLMKERFGIAVSGTHGKSTVSSLLAHLLRLAGEDPSFVIGASVGQLGGSSHAGAGKCFVAEACEYRRSFLHLYPRASIVLNIEEDHLDCYSGIQEIVDAFSRFVERLPREGLLVANASDRNVRRVMASARCRVETFSLDSNADWRAGRIEGKNGYFSFDVFRRRKYFGTFELGIPGLHNVGNSLAVVAVASYLNLSCDVIAEAFRTFRGAERRFQVSSLPSGPLLVDDYAHHPTEIEATLRTLHQAFPGRKIWSVFQPHQHSRTRFLLKDFAASFANADEILVPDIYFVRDSVEERKRISSKDLVAAITALGGRAQYLPTFDEIVEKLINEADSSDVVITMGAGNIYQVTEALREYYAQQGRGAGAA